MRGLFPLSAHLLWRAYWPGCSSQEDSTMTIGLSRSAATLLAQIVEAHQRGAQSGLSEDQLWFSLSVDQHHTTIRFATEDLSIQTDDPNALVVLRANGLIEPFTTIWSDPIPERYVVTSAGMASTERATHRA
jgi:hypothetical protein